jgi:glutamyl-tRNA reductase
LEFVVVGLNHRTAPLEVRERLALTRAELPGALKAMGRYAVPGVILCTCNRSEFYAQELPTPPGSPTRWGAGDVHIKQFLVEHFDVSLPEVDRYLYTYSGQECISHLFRVASSLDSMILGEEQIIGQVREAFDAGFRTGTASGPVSHLFQQALRVGRTVRRETGIGHNAFSVSRACVELAKTTLGDLTHLTAMVVGSGDAGGLAAEMLNLSGVKDIVVTNRTHQRAVELANDLSGRAIPFQEMPAAIRDVDIVIGCTGSPGYVLEAGMVGEAMASRAERPLFLIDIAVPRDIDPAVGQLSNVVLHDVDDLESISTSKRREKEREAQAAEELVREEAELFVRWCRSQEAPAVVTALRNQAEGIRAAELNKTLRKLSGKLDSPELASLEAMTRAIVNKLLHGPTVYLKGQRTSDDLHVARDMFRLSDEEDEESSHI